MALPTNTATTFATVGIREDLSDKIFRVGYTDTPFLSMIQTGKATSTLHEWQTQDLDAIDTNNAVLQGDDATTDAQNVTVRLNNRTQISDKVARVTGSVQAVDTAGRSNELTLQEVVKAIALKNDMEANLVGNNQAKVTGDSTTAPKCATVLSWIKTNTSKGTAGGAADPTAADGTSTRTDGTQLAYTEARLKTVLQAMFSAVGPSKADTLMLGGFNKQVMSTFTGRATVMEDAKSKKIVSSVDVYEGDFHTLKVVANARMRTRDVLILDKSMWKVCYLTGRKFVSIPLAVTGDSTRRQILSEYTLESCNEKTSGGVFDNTTS
jgi:hypothetical protein